MLKFEKLNTKGKVWISSDIHYNHKNICRGVTNWRTEDGKIPFSRVRDFDTLEQMNDKIVNNINERVGQDDTFIILGDIAFGGHENIAIFLDRLICKDIHLVYGNHDQNIKKNRENIQSKFSSVNHCLEITIEDYNFVMFHFPIMTWHGLQKGVIHLYGHVHSPKHKRFSPGKSMDVGLDGNDLKPYDLMGEIVPMMEKRKIDSSFDEDHHLEKINGLVG